MTVPAYIHQALIPLDSPPRPLCGDFGPSAANAADVTCPACLDLAAARKARTDQPAVVHQASVPDAGVVSCGGVGKEAFLPSDVTCPACQKLNGRPVVHDSHAISAGDDIDDLAVFRAQSPRLGEIWFDKSARPLLVAEDHAGWYLTTLDGLGQFRPSMVGTFGPMTRARIVPADAIVLPEHDPVLIDKDGDRWQVLAWHAEGDVTMPISRVRRDYGPLTLAGQGLPATPVAEPVKSCPSCPHCGETFHVEDAPAKTHDLTIERRNGNVVIAVERETDVHRVYLQEGVARDLGYVLAPLTPAQRQLLIDDLMGGAR